MNIYDEAKQELIEVETYLEHSLEHIDKALERAKKEHELLGLYKERLQVEKRYSREGCYFDYEDIVKLDEQIKELEEIK